ncbi:MAG: hypothetical protein M1816_004382 [Peltula sp. TS41687]|nr:MAG: hypothetical protein M1816_004382 [Peltula sp. TS41687]
MDVNQDKYPVDGHRQSLVESITKVTDGEVIGEMKTDAAGTYAGQFASSTGRQKVYADFGKNGQLLVATTCPDPHGSYGEIRVSRVGIGDVLTYQGLRDRVLAKRTIYERQRRSGRLAQTRPEWAEMTYEEAMKYVASERSRRKLRRANARPAVLASPHLLPSVRQLARHATRPRVPSEGQPDPLRPVQQQWIPPRFRTVVAKIQADAAALPGLPTSRCTAARNALVIAATTLGSRVDKYNQRMKKESGDRKSLSLVEHGQHPAAVDDDNSDDEEDDGGDDGGDGGGVVGAGS